MKALKILVVAGLVLALSAGVALAQDKVKITVATGAVGIEKELSEEAAALYMEAHPDVEIVVLDTPDRNIYRLGLAHALAEQGDRAGGKAENAPGA